MSLESEQVIFAAGINITRQKDTERALRESEQKFLKLVEGAPCASFVFELANAQILLLNQMARELLALPSFQALSANVRDLFHVPADVQALLDDLQRHQVVRDREIQIRNAYGEAQWFHLSATLIEYEGRMVALCAMLNIEMRRRAELELLQARVDSEHANRELRAANIELERLAATDRLTQSYNRRYFEEVAINEISRSRRYNVPLAVIVMDLDHFKAVNDQYGHAMGDTVLIEFSRVIRQKLRTSDTFARWGGEEFLVLATSTGLDEANILAEKLRELWAEHRVENLPPVTLSAGVTLLSYKDTLDTFIRRADAALYRAKSEGRNRVVSIGPDALVH